MRSQCSAVAIVASCLLLLGATREASQRGSVMQRATGSFDVVLKPLEAYAKAETPLLGRMSLNKQFHGDLEGTSIGEMLTGMTDVKDSGVYVAVERFSGTLAGKRGTFILHHMGLMERGAQKLSINIVPDSGTGELVGISGSMAIDIRDGKHSYTLEYPLK